MTGLNGGKGIGSTSVLKEGTKMGAGGEKTAYLAGPNLLGNTQLLAALKELEFRFEELAGNDQDPNNPHSLTAADPSTDIIIFDDFSGPLFDSLRRSKIRIFGVPVILTAAGSCGPNDRRLPFSTTGYPLYCHHLRNCKVAATGIRSRDQLHLLRRYILYMDGIFLEKEAPLTHLVADKVKGDKYRDAVALGKPILKPEWVEYLWQERNHFIDLNTNMDEFKLKAFHKCKLAFEGFEESEKMKMVGCVETNGGICVEPDDPEATHIVRVMKEQSTVVSSPCTSTPTFTTPVRRLSQLDKDDESQSPIKRPRFEFDVINDLDSRGPEALMQLSADKAKVLKVEWFWSSIQIDACAAESDYLFFDSSKTPNEFGNASIGTYGNSFTSPTAFPLSDTDGGTPNSGSGTPQSIGRRKRKRHRDPVRGFTETDRPHFMTVIPEDVASANLGGNSLDKTPQDISDADFASLLKVTETFLVNKDYSCMSKRHIEFLHLIETERNYVGILLSIVKYFKEPCEDKNQMGGRILDPIEVKTIFGSILPIYALHRLILRDMVNLQISWQEDNLIGKVYCDHMSGFRKAYEPFVNFFEAIKAEITRCESEKPRFLAFLRIAQGRVECGKQTLADLMIRPVQRLPSTSLIIGNLRKHTPETNPDFAWISQAYDEILDVGKAINEKKRSTESTLAMFDIYNEVEGCPATVLSSHRQVVIQLECFSLNTIFGPKHEPMSMFVFNDMLILAKRRQAHAMSRGVGNSSVASQRSPNTNRKSMAVGSSSNPFATNQSSSKHKPKFIEQIDFESVKRVVQVDDVNGIVFALIVRATNETRDRNLVFSVMESGVEKWSKESLVVKIAQLLAIHLQRMDHTTLIATADLGQLHNDLVSNESKSAFAKVKKFSENVPRRLSRALSFSTKTPNKFKRTVSQLFSPHSMSRASLAPERSTMSDVESSSSNTTPLRANFSSVSLWGRGSRRGNGESTPKSRPVLLSGMTESSNIFESIDES